MFRSCQIIIREFFSLLKLYYGIQNSILICKVFYVKLYMHSLVAKLKCLPNIRDAFLNPSIRATFLALQLMLRHTAYFFLSRNVFERTLQICR